MDKHEMAEQIRRANNASVQLVTMLVADMQLDAIDLVLQDPAYEDRGVMMSMATIASSAIKTLAQTLGVDPSEVMQIAGMAAAELALRIEQGEDPFQGEEPS